MRDGARVTAVIPALDEQDSIADVVRAVPGWVDQVVVVDNGSSDQTADRARSSGATVVFEPRRGYGRACLAGLAAMAPADIVVFLDADGSDDPGQADRLVDPLVAGRADLVIGSRRLGRAAPGSMTLPQRVGNALASGLISLLWRRPTTDLGPFRAIRAAALGRLGMDDPTYGWTVQMQLRAIRAGLATLEVPVDGRRRTAGRSKISGTVRGVLGAGAKILGTIAVEGFRPRAPRERPVERLGIFARFPEPGWAKTRLIPALGPERAARLHHRMMAHTLAVVDRLAADRAAGVEVWCTGADPGRFEEVFGAGRDYRTQPEGDLGVRLSKAFTSLLAEASSAIVIGTDCPALSPANIAPGFDRLRMHDVVIGPAVDGGYYLLGLRRPMPGLFDGIAWGTARVLDQTLERVRALGVSCAILDPLRDVDVPADLPESDRVFGLPRISVIIPACDEATLIRSAIGSASRAGGVEVIVADGGSTDGTQSEALASGARVISAARGRAVQMNAGAAEARGDILLFLHADTVLPEGWNEQVRRILAEPGVAAGAFTLRIDAPGVSFRILERLIALRGRFLSLPYGDQALFLRADLFRKIGGFPRIPIMEDVQLVRRIRSVGSVSVVSAAVLTSARRWVRRGIARSTLVNLASIAAYRCGGSPERIAAWRGPGGTMSDVKASNPAAVVPEPQQSPS